MPSAADVARQRYIQASVTTAAKRTLATYWAGLDQSHLVAAREQLEEFWPALIDTYGAASAEAAAQWMEQLVGAAELPAPMNVDQMNARMRWALGAAFKGNPAQSLSTLGVVADELVKQHGRDTVAVSSAKAGVRWARVPSGATCAWCLMLASRGAVYGSAASAGDGVRYHGDCDCVPTPIRDSRDLPAGYDPGALDAQYVRARQEADSGSTTKILAALRSQQNTN